MAEPVKWIVLLKLECVRANRKPRIICRAGQNMHRGFPLDEQVGIPALLSPNPVAMMRGSRAGNSPASVLSITPTTDPLVSCNW